MNRSNIFSMGCLLAVISLSKFGYGLEASNLEVLKRYIGAGECNNSSYPIEFTDSLSISCDESRYSITEINVDSDGSPFEEAPRVVRPTTNEGLPIKVQESNFRNIDSQLSSRQCWLEEWVERTKRNLTKEVFACRATFLGELKVSYTSCYTERFGYTDCVEEPKKGCQDIGNTFGWKFVSWSHVTTLKPKVEFYSPGVCTLFNDRDGDYVADSKDSCSGSTYDSPSEIFNAGDFVGEDRLGCSKCPYKKFDVAKYLGKDASIDYIIENRGKPPIPIFQPAAQRSWQCAERVGAELGSGYRPAKYQEFIHDLWKLRNNLMGNKNDLGEGDEDYCLSIREETRALAREFEVDHNKTVLKANSKHSLGLAFDVTGVGINEYLQLKEDCCLEQTSNSNWHFQTCSTIDPRKQSRAYENCVGRKDYLGNSCFSKELYPKGTVLTDDQLLDRTRDYQCVNFQICDVILD